MPSHKLRKRRRSTCGMVSGSTASTGSFLANAAVMARCSLNRRRIACSVGLSSSSYRDLTALSTTLASKRMVFRPGAGVAVLGAGISPTQGRAERPPRFFF